jgi:hypothetical protein
VKFAEIQHDRQQIQEGKRDSWEDLQDKARKVADYMDEVKAAKFSELRGKFKLPKFQLNRVIGVMMELFPDRYEIARCADGRERKLVKKRVVLNPLLGDGLHTSKRYRAGSEIIDQMTYNFETFYGSKRSFPIGHS